MSPCPSRVVLEALLSDNLNAPIEATLDAHIQQCPECQQVLEMLTAETFVRTSESFEEQETLLRGNLVAHSAMATPVMASVDPRAGQVWPSIPGYEILGELARGGMGIVYRAKQPTLQRIVALKMLRGGLQAALVDRVRFKAEAEAVARLQHANIVQIHEAGMVGGQPYFAMEFVDGGTLAKRIQGTPQPPRQAARLVEVLAQTVQAAHERGVLHRDLKPSNILLAGSVETPLDECTPKITDFGLAKFLDNDSDLTQSRDILGTPSYMAPEQARGGSRAISPATDVYALGAILYELLTGRPPFHAESPYETVRQVIQEEPLPPLQMQRKIPRDLETICLTCLQKEPHRRYATAQALADDLGRFLNGKSIVAKPASVGQRTLKWMRRRPLLASLLTALVLFTGIALVSLNVAVSQARKAERVEADGRVQEAILRLAAEKQWRRAEQLSARTMLDLSISRCESGEMDRGLHLLVRTLSLAVEQKDADMEYVARANLACWRPYYLRAWGQLRHEDWVWAVTYSRDGRRVATGSKDRTARVWDALTGAPLTPPLVHAGPVWSVAFSPDGQTLLTGAGDDRSGTAQLWNVANGKAIGTPLAHEDGVRFAVFASDGRRFLTMSNACVRVWDTAQRRPVGTLISPPGQVNAALFSPDGNSVFTACEDGTAELWHSATGESRGIVMRHPGPVTAAVFSPNGQVLLTGCSISSQEKKVSGAARLWRVDTGRALGPPMAHQGQVKAVAFSPDGRMALSGGVVIGSAASPRPRGETRLWRSDPDDPEVARPIGPILEHPAPVWSVQFSPSGQTILTGSEDRQARLWAVGTGHVIATSPPLEGTVRQVAYSPDGRTILTASAGWNAAGRLWEAPPELGLSAIRPRGDALHAAALTADGRVALTAVSTGTLDLWDTATGRHLGKSFNHLNQPIHCAIFSPDERTILTGTQTPGDRGELHFWDRATEMETRPPIPHDTWVQCVAWSADGKYIVTGTRGGQIQLWDAAHSKRLQSMNHAKIVHHVRFTPDGRQFVSCSGDGNVCVWETATGKRLQTWPQAERVDRISVSNDGRNCLIGSRDGSVRLCDMNSGKPLLAPRINTTSVYAVAFHPDGRSILTGTADGRIQRWDTALSMPLGPKLLLGQEIGCIATSADSQILIQEFPLPIAILGHAPLALAGDVKWIRLAVEVTTGMEMDEDGTLHPLTPTVWQNRRQELDQLGGNPFFGSIRRH